MASCVPRAPSSHFSRLPPRPWLVGSSPSGRRPRTGARGILPRRLGNPAPLSWLGDWRQARTAQPHGQRPPFGGDDCRVKRISPVAWSTFWPKSMPRNIVISPLKLSSPWVISFAIIPTCSDRTPRPRCAHRTWGAIGLATGPHGKSTKTKKPWPGNASTRNRLVRGPLDHRGPAISWWNRRNADNLPCWSWLREGAGGVIREVVKSALRGP